MAESLLIMLREGFEAALVVAIVFAYLNRIERRDLFGPVWLGVVVGVALATAVGLGIHWTIGELEGEARLVAFAIISLLAAGMLTWMIFWMRRQSASIKGDLHHRIHAAIGSGRAGQGVLLVAFFAVLREGIEAALFLIAATVDADSYDVLVGGIAGLLAAALLGAVVYVGGRRLPMRAFFRVTGVLLILFAAGLCAKAVFFLQAAGDLGTVDDAFYNVTGAHWLTVDTESGRFLAGLFGWDPRPSFEQFVVWFAYIVPVTFLFLAREPRRPAPTRVDAAV
jgi:high-affinity iron transporter